MKRKQRIVWCNLLAIGVLVGGLAGCGSKDDSKGLSLSDGGTETGTSTDSMSGDTGTTDTGFPSDTGTGTGGGDTSDSGPTGATSDSGTADTGTDLIEDKDSDGFFAGPDCDDNDSEIYPGHPEVPGNSKDDNCDGETDEVIDTDIDVHCAGIPHSVERKPINILILLDRSRSMSNSSFGGQTYAEIVAGAINQLVEDNEENSRINFGLAAFPATTCASTAGDDPTEKCDAAVSPGSPLVPIGGGNATLISDQLAGIGTCGGTPISESLRWAHSYLEGLAGELAGQPTYVLLATDGAPNCNATVSLYGCTCTATTCTASIQCLDSTATYNQAASLYFQGFPVLVVGVGADVQNYTTVMSEVARWGSANKYDYYPAADPTTLSAQLKAITSALIPCELSVDWATVPEKNDDVFVDKKCTKVKVIGTSAAEPDSDSDSDTGSATVEQEIPYSADCSNPEGWHWKGQNSVNDATPLTACTTIELCTSTCNKFQNLQFSSVSTTFGCSAATT